MTNQRATRTNATQMSATQMSARPTSGGAMRQEQHARIGLLVAAFSALTFSTSGALGTSLIDAGWSPTAAVAPRLPVDALFLAVPAAWSMRGRWRTLRHQAGQVIGYGLFAVAG